MQTIFSKLTLIFRSDSFYREIIRIAKPDKILKVLLIDKLELSYSSEIGSCKFSA